ncbi:hypothetical protein [Actinophytocola sp.]|uniref:hypothetical protein n=1 Tax=Actinophytocola sp. TaxID=1872138 RepID=UPI00389B0F65
MGSTVSIIGSFRRHYQDVLLAWLEFDRAGWTVTSPLGSAIIEQGIPFVRFETDEPTWDDPTVQTVALHRILRAGLTYVVAPRGYVGRTTCYELGRLVQAEQPLYFSQRPADLPIAIPESHVLTSAQLISRCTAEPPTPLFGQAAGTYAEWERQLVAGRYLEL